MMPLRSLTVGAFAALVVLGCAAPTVQRLPSGPVAALDEPAPIAVAGEEQYEGLRQTFEALEIGDPRRSALRAGLANFGLSEAARQLKGGHREAAWTAWERTASLWDATEIVDGAPALRSAQAKELGRLAGQFEAHYRRFGSHRETLAAIAVGMSVTDGDGARDRFRQVIAWMRNELYSAEDRAACAASPLCGKVVPALEGVAELWPSPFVVDELAAAYRRRSDTFGEVALHRGRADLADLFAQAQSSTATDLARLYLRVSRPDAARDALAPFAGKSGDEPELRQAIDRLLAANAKAADAVALAELLEKETAGRSAALRVCRDASRRFPEAIEPRLCVGKAALRQNLIVVAIGAFELVRTRAPQLREAWESLLVLRQQRLTQLVFDERTAELDEELQRIEKLHEETKARFADQPLKLSLAAPLAEVGRGLYNAGRIDDAVRYFQRSLAIESTVPALEQLGTIELKRGRPREALPLFDKALGIASTLARPLYLYFRARLGRTIAEAHDLLGETAQATTVRKQTAADYALLVKLTQLPPDERAELELERAKLLYQIGEREEALEGFERAIDLKPDRGATYADALAFLVPRGEHDLALDAYHRAVGRGEVTEYLKVYCSLWILELDRRVGATDDPVARTYLESVEGAKWHHELARWATGRRQDGELEALAQSSGQKAELAFYRAMRAAAEGRLDEAKLLWRRVLATDMMAFFEFDMASYYLRHGPTKEPPPRRPPARPAPQVPDGSI